MNFLKRTPFLHGLLIFVIFFSHFSTYSNPVPNDHFALPPPQNAPALDPSLVPFSEEPSKYDLESHSRFQKSLEHLDLVLSKKSTRHSLDSFRLLDQSVLSNPPLQNLTYLNLSSIHSRIQTEPERKLIIYNGPTPIHEFETSAHSTARIGNFIVFVETEGFIPSSGIQNLLFIDLHFLNSALGKTALPVFRVPILTHSPVGTIEYESKKLILKTQNKKIHLDQEVFKVFSEIQQVAFNMTVNLLDPKTFEGASYLLDSFVEYFEKAKDLAGESLLQQILNTEESVDYFNKWGKSVAHTAQFHRDVLRKSQGDALKKFESSTTFHSTLENISKNLKTSRRMIHRVSLLTAQLSVPRPKDSHVIIRSLSMLGGGLIKANREKTHEGFRGLLHHKYFRRGAEVVAVAALAASYPVEFSQFIYQGIDLSRQILEHVLGKASDLAHLGKEAFTTTLAGFNPNKFAETYFSAEKLPHLLIGLGSIVTALYISLGIPHLIVNSYKLYQDLSKTNLTNLSFLNKLKKLKTVFIERENKQEKEFLSLLSKAAAESHGGLPEEELTPEKRAELESLLQKLEEQDRSWYQHYWAKFSQIPWIQKFQNKSKKEIDSFAGALRHLIFSYSSLTQAAFVYTKIWNIYFSLRSYLWKPGPQGSLFFVPSTWYTLLMYPNYIEKITSRENKTTLPTKINGALRSWTEERMLKKVNNKELILAWEDQIVEIESQVYKAALRRSFRALVQYLESSETLKKLYEQNGIEKLTDKTIEELSSTEKAFLRLYFDRLFEQSMHRILLETVFQNQHLQLATTELNLLSNEELKRLDIESKTPSIFSTEISPAEIQKIVDEVGTETLTQDVLKILKNRWTNSEAWASYFQHQTLNILSPDNNAQTKRLHKVKTQMKKPEAMARAVRSMMATMVVDKPMELAFLFAATAGIASGMMMPLHEEMFSADSWFHLSRYTFWNGFIFGLVTGIMADVWSKLQMDERLDKKLNVVPEGADAQLSYLKYMRKAGFNNPENTWWENQRFATELIWANMKPALVTFMIFNFASLGRFELDAYLAGYALTFLTPIMGFGYKLENMFESSAGWVARNIPKEYRHLPQAQDYINKQISRRRLEFNVVYRVYENFIGYLQWNFQLMKTATYGPRSFLRILFAGYTPTEIVANKLTDFKTHHALPAPAEWLVNKCTLLFTHNYTDGVKLKK